MATAKQSLVHFSIDAAASLFTVQAFAAGIVAVVAHSPKFAIRGIIGNIEFVPGNLQHASVELTVDVGSLEIMDEVRVNERREIERVMFDEVLEKREYPQVAYRSSNVNALKTAENMYRMSIQGRSDASRHYTGHRVRYPTYGGRRYSACARFLFFQSTRLWVEDCLRRWRHSQAKG